MTFLEICEEAIRNPDGFFFRKQEFFDTFTPEVIRDLILERDEAVKNKQEWLERAAHNKAEAHNRADERDTLSLENTRLRESLNDNIPDLDWAGGYSQKRRT